MSTGDTPLMQQWRAVKSRHPDALVLFRVGDFYELFFDDAVEGARRLDLTLTSRNNGSSRAPLAGVPAHALQTYLQRLVRQGCRVAICDQVEDAAQAKGVVRREVTELVTPGAVFSEDLLEARRNNFLVALAGGPDDAADFGLAFADLSTGELELCRISPAQLPDALGQRPPAELLLPDSWEGRAVPGANGAARTHRGAWLFEPDTAAEEVRRHYGVLNLEGFGLAAENGALVSACGALIAYLSEVQPVRGAHLRPPRVARPDGAMVLDDMTRRNLELVDPLRADARGGTLLETVDEALTPMGGRLLRRWLVAPLVEVSAIRHRQSAVGVLREAAPERGHLREALGGIRDLERLAVRVAAERCSPRDLLGVAASLARIPAVREAVTGLDDRCLRDHAVHLDPLEDVRDRIETAIDPDAPPTLADGGVIRAGYDEELDGLRGGRDEARDRIAGMQARERERTGIGSLKVGFNKVFGYYIEVTRANLDRVPDDYERRQTLANAERYVLPELKVWESKVLGAEERIAAREAAVYRALRAKVGEAVGRIQAVAERIAAVDVLAGLAEVAAVHDYVRPDVHDGFDTHIRAGRHPVVERMMPAGEFIPNDVRLDEESRVIILTGPNMAGKSTVLRQVGLITVLAQVGAFVPAREARIAVADRIFTRVGASDNLVRGQSTFMVEMNETAAILNGATERSLVLLDEIGRGTSTWDGLSVATAATEHLHERIGAKTIFATHYHELTRLGERLPHLANFSVAVKEQGDDILFLRRLVPGGADRSYGVEVARLAGLPAAVVRRARTLLAEMEAAATATTPMPVAVREPRAQFTLFEDDPHPALLRLREVEIDDLTPLQALNLLAKLREQARE